MRILALETSETIGSVAALIRDQVVAARPLDAARRSAQTLAPALRALLKEVGWRPDEVELVATTVGPGSFTGLRLGVTTAKTFAYAVGCPVLGVDTLEAIAARAPHEFRAFSTVLDAQRWQSFVARFERVASPTLPASLRQAESGEPGDLIKTEPTNLVDDEAWLAILQPATAVTGPGLGKLSSRLPPGVVVADPQLWSPTATAVGKLAWRKFQAGQRDDVFDLAPQYYRRTAAEEQWDKKGVGGRE